MANRKNETAVDMSPRAVERRIVEMSGLYELCVSLQTARPLRSPGESEKPAAPGKPA